MSTGAILLAGGRATRVGGAAKPLFDVGGRTLLAAAIDAVAGTRPITVVGPAALDSASPLPPGVARVQEEPAFGGPVAGIVTALASWEDDPEWSYVLACDLARPDRAVTALRAARERLTGGIDGICLGDAASRPQWLTGVYRTAALRGSAAALPDSGRDLSVRALLDDLSIAVITAPDATDDIDTWEDLERAKERFDG